MNVKIVGISFSIELVGWLVGGGSPLRTCIIDFDKLRLDKNYAGFNKIGDYLKIKQDRLSILRIKLAMSGTQMLINNISHYCCS